MNKEVPRTFYAEMFMNKRNGVFCSSCFRFLQQDRNRCEVCNSVLCDDHKGRCKGCAEKDVCLLKCCDARASLNEYVECVFCLGRIHVECIDLKSCKDVHPPPPPHVRGTTACVGPFFMCKGCQKWIGY